MTRRDEIRLRALSYYEDCDSYSLSDAFMAGAEWADKNPCVDKSSAEYKRGVTNQHKRDIEKACCILQKLLPEDGEIWSIEAFLKIFKREMEKEQ